MIQRHGLDRQLGLGLEEVQHVRPVEQLPTIADFLVVDQLPGSHPGLTKCREAALALADAKEQPSAWTCVDLLGCRLLASYHKRAQCLTLAIEADVDDQLPAPEKLYLDPSCPAWLTAVQPGARAPSWHAAAAEALVGKLRAVIAEEVTGRFLQRIVLVGWSDGGALAQLAATYIPLALNCTVDLRCITFDARRVMNLELARLYEQLVPCSYNMLSGTDPLFESFLCPNGLEVALLPRRPFGYVRHGRDPSFTWFPVNTPLLLSKDVPKRTTLQHPWGEPQPLDHFIHALQLEKWAWYVQRQLSVPCDLHAWLIAMQDAAAPKQRLQKLQSKLSMAHHRALEHQLSVERIPESCNVDESSHATGLPPGPTQDLAEGPAQGPPQGPGAGPGAAPAAQHDACGEAEQPVQVVCTFGTAGRAVEGDMPASHTVVGHPAESGEVALDAAQATAAAAQSDEALDQPATVQAPPVLHSQAGPEAQEHQANATAQAPGQGVESGLHSHSTAPSPQQQQQTFQPVGAALLAKQLSMTASKLTHKLENLSHKLLEQQQVAVAETGLSPRDAVKMQQQVRGLEAQLRRNNTLTANICDGELPDVHIIAHPDGRTSSLPASPRHDDRAAAAPFAADAVEAAAAGDQGHVTVLNAEKGQTEGPTSPRSATRSVSDAALTNGQLHGPVDHSLLSKTVLCAKVYPCLVAAAAVYYRFPSFPSYTGVQRTATVYDPVYNTYAYLGWIPETGTLLVSFRGTSTWQDVLQDLKQSQQGHAFLYPWLPGISVHTGFLQQLLGALGLHAEAKQVISVPSGYTHASAGAPQAEGAADGPVNGPSGPHAVAAAGAAAAPTAVHCVPTQHDTQAQGTSDSKPDPPNIAGGSTEQAEQGGALECPAMRAASADDGESGQQRAPQSGPAAGRTAGPCQHDDLTRQEPSGARSVPSAGEPLPATAARVATVPGRSSTSTETADAGKAGGKDGQRDDTLLHAAARLSGGSHHVRCVILTGHSLGGAVASLAAPLFACAYPSADIRCVSFGCPRVGNRLFACYYKSLMGFSARVVAGQDPISNMPTGQEPDFKMQHMYHHVPHTVHVDDSGVIEGGPWSLPKRFIPHHHLLRYYFHFVKPLAQTEGRMLWGLPQYQPRVLTLVDIEGDELSQAARNAAAKKAVSKEPLMSTLKQQMENSAWAQQLQQSQGFVALKQWWGGYNQKKAAAAAPATSPPSK